ncbi:MAG: DUF456 domain-containing protein [Candidatus Taylorbacteria bacterium]|nr:DUF456 domain-containing protein [Candidatus Taylorbacteria bacterium]
MSYIVLTIIFAILIFPGVFLVLIPLMPAFSYMFVMSLLFGLIDHFANLTMWEFVVLSSFFFLSLIIDYSAGVLGAKYSGASGRSILYGIVGLILGTIALPPWGGIPGMFFATFFSELLLNKKKAAALRAAAGSVFGAITGVLFNFVLAVTFWVLFIVFVVF